MTRLPAGHRQASDGAAAPADLPIMTAVPSPPDTQTPPLSHAHPSDPMPSLLSCPSIGRVISLDRIYPLVKNSEGEFRAQHSVELVKNSDLRAVVGDIVTIEAPLGQDVPLITAIQPRGNTLIRRTLVESQSEGAGKHDEQILAANIDIVLIMVALSNRSLDVSYLERQLVMAFESGAEVAIILSKSDQAKHLEEDLAAVSDIAFGCPVIVESAITGEGLQQIRALLSGGRIAVLLGRSGVGKSTLVNMLVGTELLDTNPVRSKDRAGRHTTVARRMVFLDERDRGAECDRGTVLLTGPLQGSAIIDTPGLRSIGLYSAYQGLARAFPDITGYAADCHYRNCTHTSEPNCAVIRAVACGGLPERRRASYIDIAAEVND